jgi:hypothetical protein
VVKKSSVVLFILRLFLYLSVAFLPIIHPGISVSYDRVGLILCFLIIPFEAIVAFLPVPHRGRNGKGRSVILKLALALMPLFVFSIFAGGLSPDAVAFFCAGLLSFVLTFLLFRYPRWGKASAIEPFFLAWVCFRLLAFSRSGEEAAGQSMGLTQILLVWTVAVFLLHALVVYFCLFPRSLSHGLSGAKGEILVVSLGMALALTLVFILPSDFVRNNMVINLLSDRIDRLSKPDDNDWGVPDEGGGRKGRRTIPGNEDGQQPGLRGLSEYDWPGEGEQGRRRSSGKGKGNGEGEERQQYTVMVVASKKEPVYLGSSFRGLLDPVRGFLPTRDDPLNRLPNTRLFSTWFDAAPSYDRDRERLEVFSLSTLPQNFLPYRPVALEPTVLTEVSGPLRYMHRVVSAYHTADPLALVASPPRNLSDAEKRELAPYLEVPLPDDDRAIFAGHLEKALGDWEAAYGEEYNNDHMESILAILLGFSDYQYNVSDNDNYSIAALEEFLLNTKDGDCVEFSNTAALLGRMAGIPSRVVTGYLAAGSLQTMAHLRGLAALRSKIKVLQEFPFEDLYLVTDAHAHSWPQFYIPGYGWVDFESTAFAIPPLGMGDGNMRDVVIPLIDENRVFSQVRTFPWRAVLRAVGFLAAAALLCAYLARYGREALLRIGTRRQGRQGARSLYLLLLARLAADGKPIKPASKTATEYAQLFGELSDPSTLRSFTAFAALYSELRWREFKDPAEQEERFGHLRQEYQNILKAARRPGPRAFFIRIFSLRGLAYL